LPTWRWIVRTTGTPLDVAIDFGDAYWGGSSLLVSGTLDATNDVLLYETNLDVVAGTQLQIVFKPNQTGPTHMQIGYAFADSPTTFQYADTFDATSTDWQNLAVGLGAADAGRTLAAISLRFVDPGTPTPYQMRIGQIGFAGEITFPDPPSDLAVV